MYLVPLETKLKHSTVHLEEPCPFLTPNPGVAAIRDYSRWTTETCGDLEEEEDEGEHPAEC